MTADVNPTLMEGEKSSISEWIAGGLILLFAILYRWYAVTGDIRFDPAVYAQYAYNIFKGSFHLNTDCWYAHRLPVFAPVSLIYAAFGVGKATTHLWPVFLSVLQVGAVLWLGMRWIGWRASLLAALLLAMMPLDVIYAGVLGPDAVLAAFVTLSGATWVAALEGTHRGARALLFLSGVFLALATITRIYAVLMIFFFAGHWLWRRTAAGDMIWWFLGAAVVGTSVFAIYLTITSDPLLPIKAVLGFYASPERSEGARLLYYPGLIWKTRSETGLFAFVCTAGILAAILRPNRKRLLLLAWIAPLLIYLQFGSMSLDSYVPIFKRNRFLTPLCAPAALLTALVLWEEVPLILRRCMVSNAKRLASLLAGCLLVVLGANSIWIIKNYRTASAAVAHNFVRAAGVLRGNRDIPILFDHWRTAIRFGYYFDFKEGSHLYEGADETVRMNRERAERGSRIGYLKWYKEPAELPDCFVVLEDQILAQAAEAAIGDPTRSRYPSKDIPAYCQTPPTSWDSLGRYGTMRIFRVRNRKDGPAAKSEPGMPSNTIGNTFNSTAPAPIESCRVYPVKIIYE